LGGTEGEGSGDEGLTDSTGTLAGKDLTDWRGAGLLKEASGVTVKVSIEVAFLRITTDILATGTADSEEKELAKLDEKKLGNRKREGLIGLPGEGTADSLGAGVADSAGGKESLSEELSLV